MSKPRLATLWLEGCSGCHMSFLDIDERLIDLAGKADLVFSPLVDVKEFPQNVDITLVEGGIGSEHDTEMIRKIRANTRILVSLGDCAITGNVPAMRNTFGAKAVLERAYVENATLDPGPPWKGVPALEPNVRPLHGLVHVDCHIPGCPPSADTIFSVVCDLLDGKEPDVMALTRFGK